MALCVPDRIPDKASAGEKRVFELLRTLPDDCIVYYEPKIDRRCPDFVLISPTLGLLVIEVKGWFGSNLLEGNPKTVAIKTQHGQRDALHPLEQARQYMFRLMKHCEEHLWSRPLLRMHGPHKGRFFFPFGHVAILSNINRDQLATQNQLWRTLFPPEQVVTKDELHEWSGAVSGNLVKVLSRHFDPSWPFEPMTRDQVNLLRAIIHPEILISAPSQNVVEVDATRLPPADAMPQKAPERVSEEPAVYRASNQNAPATAEAMSRTRLRRFFPAPLMKVQNSSSSTGPPTLDRTARGEPIKFQDAPSKKRANSNGTSATQKVCAFHEEGPGPAALKVLDLEQELAARAVGSGHRLLFGVAGSGKTVVLISRARLLAQVAGQQVLFLCFNVPLASTLQHILRDLRDKVDVMHFDALAKKYGASRNFAEKDDQSFGARFLAHLAKTKPPPEYDAVLIDEAQDFDPTWFQCALRLMRDPQGGDLLIAGDGNQGIYGQRRTNWSTMGINARGRTTYLKRSYRSSKDIIEFAAPFARTENREDNGVSPVAIDPAQATRPTGVKPLVFRCADRAAECGQALLIIEELLQGRFESHQLATPLQPQDIGIILPSIPKENDQLLAEFRSQLSAMDIPWVWLSDPDDRNARTRICKPGIKIQNIRHSKGLQYRAVIFLWADQLPKPGWQYLTSDEQRMLFYVALTRAEDFLTVTGSGPSAFFDLLILKEKALLRIID